MSGNDNANQDSLKVEISSRNYYSGKILLCSKPSIDVETAKNDSRLIAMFGQAEVNTKMTALAQGYEDIDLPKTVKVAGAVCTVISLLFGIVGFLPGGGLEGGTAPGENQHEDDPEAGLDIPPQGLIMGFLLLCSASVFLVLLCKGARDVAARQGDLVRNLFADWCQRGVTVRYEPGRAGGEHTDQIMAKVILQLPYPTTIQNTVPTVMVQVPTGALPGTQLAVQINGNTMSVVIPPGCQPGSSFPVQVPGPASTV